MKAMKTQTETDYLAESEAHAPLYFGVPIDSDLFVKLRPGASNDAASDDDVSSVDVVDACACHAAAASGFGDAVMDFPTPTSFELHKAAFAHRARMLGGLMRAVTGAIGALLRKE